MQVVYDSVPLHRYSDRGDPVEVMMVDFQFGRVASPATDLTYLLYTSMHGLLRRANMNTFLTTYHRTLTDTVTAIGNNPPPFNLDQLLQECRSKQEFGVLCGVMILYAIMAESSEIPDLSKFNEEDIPKLLEEFREKSLEKIEKSHKYRTRFLALFDDASYIINQYEK